MGREDRGEVVEEGEEVARTAEWLLVEAEVEEMLVEGEGGEGQLTVHKEGKDYNHLVVEIATRRHPRNEGSSRNSRQPHRRESERSGRDADRHYSGGDYYSREPRRHSPGEYGQQQKPAYGKLYHEILSQTMKGLDNAEMMSQR